MPQVGDFWEAYRASEFVLIIGDQVSPGVTKVSGLSEGEIDTIEQPDGGTNHVYKIAATKIKYEPLTIERNVDGSPEDKRFQQWFREIFKLAATVQGGSAIRKSGLIEKRHNGAKVMTFAFYNAWIKSSKFTDLEAGSTGLFKQTIVLEHEGLERVD
ncbi:phage tail protein [Planobispora longispora]|uniref:Phage tail protein n=1 Tax=Planobispora longispora TaxID=28887 RepID=A0A8J3RQ68_9ACTN|nr:phage tail protein [Planobispora longispora]BFE80544.1 phage tail protein [Planobispora longispora]GIH79215.1 phage tail protein [Planobispora longispora]